jgi:ABC-type branched-subunit amino acid transport system substrate-binding protein
MGMRTRWLVVLFVVLSLVAAACGRSDDDTEEGASETTAPADESSSGGGGSFGDLTDVCSDGDASGATAQGVTDDEIAVATFSDPGFVGRQGLNQELFDAAEVFAAWCNDNGGINGREVVVHERDAALTEYRARMTEACREDFFMVGGGAVFDDTGQEDRLTCLLPDIAGYVVSAKAKGADLLVQPVPNTVDAVNVAAQRYVMERFPDSVDAVGYLTGNVPATVAVNDQNQEAAEDLGLETVYEAQYNAAGESSWTPLAQALQSEEVKGLQWTGEPENLAKLLVALDDIGYELEWVTAAANHLDQKLIDQGGAAVNNVFIAGSVVPYFQAEDNEATQQYQDLFEEYLPDGRSQAYLGYQAFSAWLLFAQAVKECGSDVTRKCVFENAQSVEDWTGGGLHAASNPAEALPPECATLSEATPEGFQVATDFEPTEGLFDCNADNVAETTGDYGTGAKLEDVGKSIDDLQ